MASESTPVQPAAPATVSHENALQHAFSFLTHNAHYLGEIAQVAVAAGIKLSPQAQAVAVIAMLFASHPAAAPADPQV